jgi:hypothetical protein
MAAFTYPGVYIQELSSGVHPITGVATSIAAFVGWADQGPIDQAVLVQSWSDFQTQFGGLDSRSYLGYAVNQFFANGGQQAYIVRIVWDGTQPAATVPPPTACAVASATAGWATAVITAALDGFSATSTVTVGTPILQSVSITPANPPWIAAGQSVPFTAMGSYSDGSTRNMTTSVTWSASPTAVAAITNGGVATAIGTGTSTITAASGGVTATVLLTTSAATPMGIAVTPVTPATLSVAAGVPVQFQAVGSYSDGSTQNLTAAATWSFTGSGVISGASGGLATTTAAGQVTITAAWGGVAGIATLTVTTAVVERIAITPANPTIQTGAPLQFAAIATNSDGTASDLTNNTATAWASSTSAATIVTTTPGLFTASAAGDTTITATFTQASGPVIGTATLAVTAATLKSITVTPATPSVLNSQTLQFTATGAYSDSTSADLTSIVTWVAAAPAVANFTSTTPGLVTGLTPGSSGITATLGGLTSPPITLTVDAPVLTSITVTSPNPPSAIATGQTVQFNTEATYNNGTQATVTGATWSSSAPTVVSVNTTSGLAQAVGNTLTLYAKNPGAWGNNIQVSVVLQAGNPSRFSLQVQQILPSGSTALLESFANLSYNPVDPQGQYVVTVIDNDSAYLTFVNPQASASPIVLAGPPVAATVTLSGGNDGSPLTPATDGNFETALLPPNLSPPSALGLHLLDVVDIFNLLCVPGETDQATIQDLQAYCVGRRAFYIVDCPQLATTANLTTTGPVGTILGGGSPVPGAICGTNSINSAYYYPWVSAPDPLAGNRSRLFPPCGFVAGNYAATDASRGVWKAPAGIDASLTGVSGLQYVLNDAQNGSLNPQAINCLRQFNVYGDVVWGARTLQGNDQAGSQWKYVPIKRLALFLESSLYDGLQWVVFEPNAEPLWGQIRLNVGAFMQGLFLQGAFQGTTPAQAYFVKCDSENNPQASIDLGIVNILVGFAPLYPAEFVVIQIQQMAGQVQS